MTERKTISSWMWATDNGDTNGATVDLNLGMIYWFDAVGCACSSHTSEQTLAQYRQNGSPLGGLPADVLAEIQAVVSVTE